MYGAFQRVMISLLMGAGLIGAQTILSKNGAADERGMAALLSPRADKPEGPALAIDDSLFFLSPGDRLKLQWWGVGSGAEDLIVNTRWEVVVPDRGLVKVKGIPFSKVRDSLEALIRSQLRVKLIDLQVVEIVPAQVQVTGLVPNPGAFEVAAGMRLSALLKHAGVNLSEALRSQAAGTPPRQGDRFRVPSARRILLVRGGGRDSVWCDLARAWNAGSLQDDPRLFTGDRVQVYQQGPLVALSGNVPFGGYLEYVPGETVESLLQISGIQDHNLSVEGQNIDGVRRVLRRTDLLDSNLAVIELPNLTYRPMTPIVWIAGCVKKPGGYIISNGMTSRDLMKLAGGSLVGDDSTIAVGIKRGWTWLQAGRRPGLEATTQYPEVKIALSSYIQQMRGNYADPDARLQAGDSVIIHQAEQVVWVGGLVNRPGFVTWKPGLTADDYIAAAGGYAQRAWTSRVRIYDLYTDQVVPLGQPIRQGSAILVPEERYISWDQWIVVVASIITSAVSAGGFYLQVTK